MHPGGHITYGLVVSWLGHVDKLEIQVTRHEFTAHYQPEPVGMTKSPPTPGNTSLISDKWALK